MLMGSYNRLVIVNPSRWPAGAVVKGLLYLLLSELFLHGFGCHL